MDVFVSREFLQSAHLKRASYKYLMSEYEMIE